jgi:hypothetical protein
LGSRVTLLAEFIRFVGNKFSEFVGTIEENVLVPVFGISTLNEEGDHPNNKLNNPEDNNSLLEIHLHFLVGLLY